MKKLIATAFICFGLTGAAFCQHICAAAFLGNKMIVDQYTKTGYKNEILQNAKGDLTVNSVELSPKENKAIEAVPFKIAIKEKSSQTISFFSKDEFMKVDVQKVLSQCKKGDSIILYALDKQYSLPHNEIVVK